MTAIDGTDYVDFFCGAGALNYGHNHGGAKEALLSYLMSDGIQHSLDMVTDAKVNFVEALQKTILLPRGLDYRIQFTGPTGTNAVEAAIKLARKQTRRSHIVAFTNGYHGHSLGSLALTANQNYHCESYGSHDNVTHLPFDGYLGDVDTSLVLEKMLEDRSSGLPMPAAIILETVQGEGGVNVARDEWLRRISSICERYDIRMIVDDIQVGCGRTGKFFSFEDAGIFPDIVCLSKSIGGGLPLSLVLMKREFDVWRPGEHTGTFRGNNLAFVAATAVLKHWESKTFESEIMDRSRMIQERLEFIVAKYQDRGWELRGRGLIWGLEVDCGETAAAISHKAFESGLLIESAGTRGQVLKVMPALNIETDLLERGLEILINAIKSVVAAQDINAVQCVEAAQLLETDSEDDAETKDTIATSLPIIVLDGISPSPGVITGYPIG